jgi:hypothetical protein
MVKEDVPAGTEVWSSGATVCEQYKSSARSER